MKIAKVIVLFLLEVIVPYASLVFTVMATGVIAHFTAWATGLNFEASLLVVALSWNFTMLRQVNNNCNKAIAKVEADGNDK